MVDIDDVDIEVGAMAAMYQATVPLDWGQRIRAAEWLLARLKAEQPSVPGPRHNDPKAGE